MFVKHQHVLVHNDKRISSSSYIVMLRKKGLKYRFRLQKGVKMKNGYDFRIEHGRIVHSYIYHFPN